VERGKHPPIGTRTASEAEDVEVYWELARKVVPTLYRLKGNSRPLPFIEDVAVAPALLPEFLSKLFEVLRRHQVTASIFGHAGHGQLHIRPLLDLADRRDVEDMERISREVYHEVLLLGGTISGEHGDGLSRTQFIKDQYGPLYNTFRDLKEIFDPKYILNPGKIISQQETLTRNLRPVGTVPIQPASGQGSDRAASGTELPSSTIQLQLSWNADQIAHAARNCNGCGACRSELPEVRMCPIFRLAPREEASPRAKANLLRGVLTGRLNAEAIASEDFKKVIDLCVNCHQCRLECPANVDIPKLMTEAKAAHIAVTGLKPTDWLLSNLDRIGAIGCRLSRLANWAIANRVVRFCMEKTMNIAQGRKLPRFARQNFLRRAARRKLTRPIRGEGLKVLYFADIYATYYDTALAEATVDVLAHNGVSVYVEPRQMQSGMAMVSLGAVDAAKKIAAHNVELLAERIHQGYQIVTSEPAAASCLIHEYPNLLDNEDTKLVAEHTSETCSYLWKLHQAGKMRLDLKPLPTQLAYHQPCHIRSLGVGSPGENLLKLIPGITVHRLERGCSGMAGTYGLRRENYRSSLRAGFDLISGIREPRFHAGTTECSTCKIQMEQGTTKPTIHPVKLLAWAYGLTPEGQNPLHLLSHDLTVS
jgi:Fe-S oxidoreductase